MNIGDKFYKVHGGYTPNVAEFCNCNNCTIEDKGEYYEIVEIVTDLKEEKIAKLKQKLFETDFKAVKFAEGQYTEEEYKPLREQRKLWRQQINELEG